MATDFSQEVRQLLTDAMSRLLFVFLEADPVVVHETLSFSQLLWLFVARAPTSRLDHLFQDLFAFFDTLSLFHHSPASKQHERPHYNTVAVLEAVMTCPPIECMCRFAITSPQGDLQHLVKYLLRYLCPGRSQNIARGLSQDHHP